MTDKEVKLFKIGDKIEIYRKNSAKKDLYPSKILDILGDELIISGPMKKHSSIFLHKDEILTIVSLFENKGRYEFDAKVKNRHLGKLYTVKLKRVSEIRKIQLRDFFRFEISIPVLKRTTVIEDEKQKTLIENCRTKDISGGGLRLLTNYLHNVGDITECEFKIEESTISSKAKIIRIEPVDTFDYKYNIGVEFVNISEKDRDSIVKFIFSRQRALREKGLI